MSEWPLLSFPHRNCQGVNLNMSRNHTIYRSIQKAENSEPLWADKKRPIFGLPLSFTYYSLFPDRLVIESGFLIRRREEIRLYRLVDVSLREGLLQRFFGLGSVKLMSGDTTAPKFFLHDIRQPQDVVSLISDLVEEERRRNNVTMFESY